MRGREGGREARSTALVVEENRSLDVAEHKEFVLSLLLLDPLYSFYSCGVVCLNVQYGVQDTR